MLRAAFDATMTDPQFLADADKMHIDISPKRGAEVQQMVEESVEHAFEDLRARQWIETALRARQTIAAACKGLVECVGEIDTDYRTKVENALKAVENLLADGEAATQSGDATKLKAALTALDEVTQPLADLMMDKAMEALLRKRGLVK